MAKKISVWCWRDGRLEFGVTCPSGALPVATGPEEDLREIVDVLATHGYDGKTLLIGNLAEATKDGDGNAAQQALWDFCDGVELRLRDRREKRMEACHA